MVVIILRHANDEYPNPTKRDDFRITTTGARRARRLARELIKQYGAPKKIYCSPFERTMETVNQMITQCDKKPIITPDNNLGRFFNDKEKVNPKIFDTTRDRNPHLDESWNGFKRRVGVHQERLRRNGYFESKTNVVWCITHTLVLNEIAKCHGIKLKEWLDFLAWFPIDYSTRKKRDLTTKPVNTRGYLRSSVRSRYSVSRRPPPPPPPRTKIQYRRYDDTSSRANDRDYNRSSGTNRTGRDNKTNGRIQNRRDADRRDADRKDYDDRKRKDIDRKDYDDRKRKDTNRRRDADRRREVTDKRDDRKRNERDRDDRKKDDRVRDRDNRNPGRR